jgi:hypothetical protein
MRSCASKVEALRRPRCSVPELDPELFASQVGYESKTQKRMGSGSGFKKIVSDPQHCKESEWLDIRSYVMHLNVKVSIRLRIVMCCSFKFSI